jgi:hypothetical protein
MSDKITTTPEIRIRAADEQDLSGIGRVAGRDSTPLPDGPFLVAEVGDDVRAAISLADGTVVADPFHRTAELVAMLRIRAREATAGRAGNVVKFERPRRSRMAFRSAA